MKHLGTVLKDIAQNMSVLYAEDDNTLRVLFAESLEKYFKSVVSAEDGVRALEEYKKGSFDLVITDIMMPNMDGLNLIKNIKNINPEQKIAVISAYSDSDRLLEFINLGVDGFLVKPLQNDRLVAMLLKIVRQINDFKIAREYEKKILDMNALLEAKVTAMNNALRAVLKAQNIAITVATKKDKMTEGVKLKQKRVVSAKEFMELEPFSIENKINILEDIEDELDIAINRAKSADSSCREALANVVEKYASVIGSFEEFANVSFALHELALKLVKYDDFEFRQEIIDILFSIADNLSAFRSAVFVEKSAHDIHYLDNSLIADITLLERMIRGESANAEFEMELF